MIRKAIHILLIAVLVWSSIFFPMDTEAAYTGSVYSKATYEVEMDKLLSDFESGGDGWTIGENTGSVDVVSTFQNGPGKPYHGSNCLLISSTDCAGTAWRAVSKSISPALDLRETPYVVLAANTYGIGGAYTDFEVRVTLYSGSNSQSSATIINGDKWTPLHYNFSDWSYINSVDKVEVSFRSASYTGNWPSGHEIDYIGFSSSEKWDFNSDWQGWSVGSALAEGSVNGGYLNVDVTGEDPYMFSPTDFIADASKARYFSIRMKNGTPGTKARVYWKTSTDDTWSQSKSAEFDIVPDDYTYRNYGYDLGSNSLWSDKITQMRLDLPDNGDGTGSISVGFIQLSTRPEDVYYGGSVDSISASSDQIIVSGKVNCSSTQTIDIIELQPYEKYNFFAGYTLAATVTVIPVDGVADFSVSFDRFDNSVDRIYSKFVVIVNDTVKKKLDVEKYVTVFPSSENNYDYPTAKSIKGLQVKMVDDALNLGVQNAALNFTVNSLFYMEGSNPSDTIPYVMDGETFYIKKGYIEDFDKSVKALSDKGVIVTLIVLMQDEVDAATPNQYIIHPDHIDGRPIYAFNTTEAMGTKYFKAAMEFIVSRYTRADQAYGRAVNYIIGNEVDMGIDWYDMGEKEMCDFIDQYARTIRIANTAAKKIYSNARVFISLTHNWNMRGVANDWQYYKGRDIVDGFNARILEQGNIPWNIAYHPYPEDLGDPRIWEDTSTVDSFDTPKINFKNLHILSNYINRPDYYYDGAMRRIILSEEGFHSLTNSYYDQKVQAAAFAYSYYKAKFTQGIDAFILHRHVDHRDEGGLNLGIWMRDTSKTEPDAPGMPKYLYNVYARIDTSDSEKVTEFAKSIIGISSWDEVIPGWDNTKLADQPIPQAFTTINVSERTASVIIDGISDDGAWASSNEYTIGGENTENVASIKTLWDTEKIYVSMNVKDDQLINAGSTDEGQAAPFMDDSVDIYIDGDLTRSLYNSHTAQYVFRWDDTSIYKYGNDAATTAGIEFKMTSSATNDGYTFEAAIPWAAVAGLTVEKNKVIGLTFHVNDRDSEGIKGTLLFTPTSEEGGDWLTSKNWAQASLAVKPAEFTITASSGSNGTISPSGEVRVTERDDKTFTFIADEGYEVDKVTVDGVEVRADGNNYTFREVSAGHSINVTFVVKNLGPADMNVVKAAEPIQIDGSLSDDDWTIGQEYTMSRSSTDNIANIKTLWDTEKFYVSMYIKDNKLVNANSTSWGWAAPFMDDSVEVYIDGDLTRGEYNNHTVQYIFRWDDPNIYKYGNGAASTEGVEFKMVPTEANDGYIFEAAIPWAAIGGLTVEKNRVVGLTFHVNDRDSEEGDDVNTLVFTRAPEGYGNYQTSANWAKAKLTQAYTITVSSGKNGAVSPDNEVVVIEGEDKTFTFIPEPGYRVNKVTVDGSKVEFTDNSYTFTEVMSNHSINVKFNSGPPKPKDK